MVESHRVLCGLANGRFNLASIPVSRMKGKDERPAFSDKKERSTRLFHLLPLTDL